MAKGNIDHFLGKVFKKIGPKIGARVLIEPRWGLVGQVAFKNGKKTYFRYNSLDLNPLGASEISKDKDYANFFMGKMGYPVVPGRAFYSRDWALAIGSKKNIHAAYTYAKSLGFPVIVKPNSGSQGMGVSLVHNRNEFYKAMNFIFSRDRVALVQRPIVGNDYRIVVLDGKVISAYQRLPLSLVGDGKSSIAKLLGKKQLLFKKLGRDTKIKPSDFRIAQKLKHQGFNKRSVLAKGQKIFLLDNANLSSGGDSLDVTKQLHPKFKKIAGSIAHDMGLRLCGVDLIIEGSIEQLPVKFWVLETNAAPGLDHYVLTGKKQEKIVEAMYEKVLRAMM